MTTVFLVNYPSKIRSVTKCKIFIPALKIFMVGAVRQVRGGAEVGFWVVCWVARGGARARQQSCIVIDRLV
eukprot:COSAG05_NODE_27_length_29281_cov_199.946919_14_plen_71_part_00